MQTADRLIRTKLRPPYTRGGLVARPRLDERLRLGLAGPLTLLTAPAGFGKTTLLAAWLSASGLPVAWLSLDKDDNHPARFLSYLIAACQTVDPAVGCEAAELLADAQAAPPQAILTSLVNDLDRRSQGLVLVLDDYQFISSAEVHEALAFVLEHCPPSLHLVIATRSDPPLPLARFQGRGLVVDLRAGDLRFTQGEAGQFLNEAMGLGLDPAAVAVLAERTEGWISGLQMAALSLRACPDVPAFLHSFSGTNRYILDYLIEEVLAGQPAEVQEFLLRTAILERLSAGLCAAVLEEAEPVACQAMLERLERANLFLAPLDEFRQWYRYHHLFAELLRARLDQVHPGLAARLHGRAAAWYEASAAPLEAIQHASQAGDYAMIERLIEQNYTEMMNHGEMAWIRFWTGRLKAEAIVQRPWLCLYEALNYCWFGQLEEAGVWLEKAEKCIQAQMAAPDAPAMLAYHAYVQSRVVAMEGDTRRAIDLCRSACNRIPGGALGLQIDFSITLGYLYFLAGDFERARQTLSGMIQSGWNARAVNNPVAGYAVLARMAVYQGQLQAAKALLERAGRLIEQAGGGHRGVAALVDAGLAGLLCEWNDLDAALGLARRAIEYLPLWGKADDLCLAYTTLARIQWARGEADEAAAAIEQAAGITRTTGVFSEARAAVEAGQVRAWLARGEAAAWQRWLAAAAGRWGVPDRFRYEDELAHLAQARLYLAQEEPGAALPVLAGLEGAARAAGRTGRLVEILLVTALAHQIDGKTGAAETALKSSLALAAPEGYLRLFLDEGPRLHGLLAQLLSHTRAGALRSYAGHLLGQGLARPAQAAGAAGLVEPLSRREREVLALLAGGLTNRQIAARLVVSPGTVKAHTASLYRKLEAGNRTEAVARARQLGLVE